MSIQQNFPAISPSLNLNFARSKTLDPRITFSRTTTATRVNEQGLIEVVSADIPRFDHKYDASTGVVKSLGLLVEEARTNLVTHNSTDFNYSINNQIIATQLDIAPDGNSVLCKHDLTGATSPFLNCRANTTLSAGQTYTMSMWLKGTTNFNASFAFVGESPSEIYANTANITTSWQRFTLTFTLVNTQTSSRLQVFFGTQGEGKVISIWGAQLEQGAFATSYIPRPVAGQQSTRTPDNASMFGENFSDWFNTDEGTLHMRISSTQGPQSGYPRLLMLTPAGQNSQNNSLQFIHSNSSVGLGFALWEGGTIRKGYGKNVTGSEDKENIVFAYKSDGDTSVYVDGNSLTNTISATYAQPVFGRMGIGAYPGGEGTTPRTTIESLVYYPRRLTNAQLQNLTK